MAITLSNYRPFDITMNAVDHIKEELESPSPTLFLAAAKIVRLAAMTLALILAAVLDIIYIPSSLIYRKCCKTQATHITVQVNCPPLNEPQRLFKAALQSALSFNDTPTQNIYKQLVIHDGTLDHGEAPINIYQWSAGCLLAHYLSSLHVYRRIECYPDRHPLEIKMKQLHSHLHKIQERGAILLQVMVPSNPRLLNYSQKKIVDEINSLALDMSQDQVFLHQIYDPVASEMKRAERV